MLTKDAAGTAVMEKPVARTSAAKTNAPAPARKPLRIYIDGEFFDEAEAKISVFDHGLLYGDGIFDRSNRLSAFSCKNRRRFLRFSLPCSAFFR